MFNYYKDIIINDVSNCLVDNDTKMLVIKRGGNYDLSKIEGLKIYKTIGNAGTNAVVTIDQSKLNNSKDFYQIAIFPSTPTKELGEYAMANYAEFGKPVLVEVGSKDADKIVAALNLALPYDNPFYKAEKASSKVKITFAKSWMNPADIKIFEGTTTDGITTLTENTTSGLVTLTTPNVPEFATGNWLIENLRFPAYPNVRYAHPYADETPVPSTVYVQYAFNYKTERPVQGGLNVANEEVNAVSNHVFYVPSASASTFEGLFEDAGYTATSTAVPDGQTSKYEITLAAASEESETEG